MEILNNDIIRWTGEGLEEGAENLLIIKDHLQNFYYPLLIMPGECIDEIIKDFKEHLEIVDAVSLSLLRQLFVETA